MAKVFRGVRAAGIFGVSQPAIRVIWFLCALVMLASHDVMSQETMVTPATVMAAAAPLRVAQSASATTPQPMRWIASDDGKVTKGKALFAVCGACHGTEGEGRQGIGPRLTSQTFLAAASDNFLVRTISAGRVGTTMIPWGTSFQAEDIHSIVVYIRSLNPVPAATLNEAPLQGDTARGEHLFTSICAGCHGRTGAGYQETANGTGIGRAAFLTEVSNGYLRYIIKHGKSGTKMRPFAQDSKVAVVNLSDQQIDDVIAYLRSHAW